jgi:hypothetical protein
LTPHATHRVAVLASGRTDDHADPVALPPELLDKVMSELVAVSASATSKREEAANLARIWHRRPEQSAGEDIAAPASA